MRTLEQLRAADALARVDELAKRDVEFKKCYRSYVERLGPGIVMNGLGQALASERAAAGAYDEGEKRPKGHPQERRRDEGEGRDDDVKRKKKAKDDAHHQLYHNLNLWLCRAKGGVYPGASDLLAAIVAGDESHYLRAQAEAIAWIEWHKKFCRATFPRGERE
ncbi:MAG TPA: type III-B CRISPR module-associated protein Cmr5 [Nannocystaceae bacterium]|nr:type III-B CRISPR module-associated protein Cmr5 [Nannocystaceae bacterium]